MWPHAYTATLIRQFLWGPCSNRQIHVLNAQNYSAILWKTQIMINGLVKPEYAWYLSKYLTSAIHITAILIT